MCSCSPQKRLNRLLKKHPELSVTKDTTFRDTIWLNNTQIDTVFNSSVDTVILKNDSIKITYIKVKDKIYLKGETILKPVIRERTVSIKSPVITKTVMREHWYHKPLIWWFILTVIALICIFLWKLVMKPTLKQYLRI